MGHGLQQRPDFRTAQHQTRGIVRIGNHHQSGILSGFLQRFGVSCRHFDNGRLLQGGIVIVHGKIRIPGHQRFVRTCAQADHQPQDGIRAVSRQHLPGCQPGVTGIGGMQCFTAVIRIPVESQFIQSPVQPVQDFRRKVLAGFIGVQHQTAALSGFVPFDFCHH